MADDFTLKPDYTFETTREFKTLVSKFENGAEQRRNKWPTVRRTWHLIFKNRDSTDLSTITTLFDAKLGALTAFTWTNPVDSATYTVRFKEDSLRWFTDTYGLYNVEFDLVEVTA